MATPMPRAEAVRQIMARADDLVKKEASGFFRIQHIALKHDKDGAPEYVAQAVNERDEVLSDDRGPIVSDPYRLPGPPSHC